MTPPLLARLQADITIVEISLAAPQKIEHSNIFISIVDLFQPQFFPAREKFLNSSFFNRLK